MPRGGTRLVVAGALQRWPQRPDTSRVPGSWLSLNGPPPSSGARQGSTCHRDPPACGRGGVVGPAGRPPLPSGRTPRAR